MDVRLIFLVALLFSFLYFGNVVKSQGNLLYEISNIEMTKNPKVFDNSNLSVEVTNNFGQDKYFRLAIAVIEEGIATTSSNTSFFLGGGKRTSVPFSFYVDSIGKQQMIIKLFLKDSDAVIDSKIVTFEPTSDIGPFDLSIDTPTTINPVGKIPIIVRTTNNGVEGTDIDLRITVRCFNQPDFVSEFVYYIEGMKDDQRVVSARTCLKEEGLHSAYAEMIFYNKTILSALTQFYTNDSSLKLLIDTSHVVDVKANSSRSFDVNIKNPNNVSLDNLNLIISNIPSSWYDVNPQTISTLAPGQNAVFIVNLTIPPNTTSESYPITMYAASSQFLDSIPIQIQVSNAVASVEKTSQVTIYVLLIIVPAGLGIIGVWYLFRKRSRSSDIFMDYELSH